MDNMRPPQTSARDLVYLVLEESNQISDVQKAELNKSIVKTFQLLNDKNRVRNSFMLSVLAFADDVHELMPLSHCDQSLDVSGIQQRGVPSFSNLFRDLATRIHRDNEELSRRNCTIDSSIVVLVTKAEAQADDDWRPGLAELKKLNPANSPSIVLVQLSLGENSLTLRIKLDNDLTDYSSMVTGTTDLSDDITEVIQKVSERHIIPFYFLSANSSPENSSIKTITDALLLAKQDLRDNNSRVFRPSFCIAEKQNEKIVESSLADICSFSGTNGVNPDPYIDLSEALDGLKTLIDKDVKLLKASGYKMLQPVAFVFPEGFSITDGWTAAHNLLVAKDNPYRPQIISIGSTNCDQVLLDEIASQYKAEIPKLSYTFAGDGEPSQLIRRWVVNTTLNCQRGLRASYVPRIEDLAKWKINMAESRRQ